MCPKHGFSSMSKKDQKWKGSLTIDDIRLSQSQNFGTWPCSTSSQTNLRSTFIDLHQLIFAWTWDTSFPLANGTLCSLCRFRLSESFRFGPEIAACSNALLNFADGGHTRSVRVVGSGPHGEVVKHGEGPRDRSGTTVLIARSNKGQDVEGLGI